LLYALKEGARGGERRANSEVEEEEEERKQLEIRRM
jgi:hypothetical protein